MTGRSIFAPFLCAWLTAHAVFLWVDPPGLVRLVQEIDRDPVGFLMGELVVALVCVVCSLIGRAGVAAFGWKGILAPVLASSVLSLCVAVIYSRWAMLMASV